MSFQVIDKRNKKSEKSQKKGKENVTYGLSLSNDENLNSKYI